LSAIISYVGDLEVSLQNIQGHITPRPNPYPDPKLNPNTKL